MWGSGACRVGCRLRLVGRRESDLQRVRLPGGPSPRRLIRRNVIGWLFFPSWGQPPLNYLHLPSHNYCDLQPESWNFCLLPTPYPLPTVSADFILGEGDISWGVGVLFDLVGICVPHKLVRNQQSSSQRKEIT